MGKATDTKPTALAVANDYGDMAGSGFEGTSSADTSIPFLRLIQSMSPELKGETKVKGAESGMFINSISKELFDGKTGIVIQPCAIKHVYAEWKPKDAGGGLVGMHELDSEIVKNALATQEFPKYKSPAGNDLVETYYVAALMHRSEVAEIQATEVPEPMVLVFKSTAIKPYRTFFTRVNQMKGKIPLFAHRVKITSKPDKNGKGDFDNWNLQPLVDNDLIKSLIPAKLGEERHPLLLAGNALREAYQTGQAEVRYDKGDGNDAGAKKDGDAPF